MQSLITCLMPLIVIGEYAAKIPDEVQKQYPDIAWRDIKAARNFYVHTYMAIGWQRIWETIHSQLLPLRVKLAAKNLSSE